MRRLPAGLAPARAVVLRPRGLGDVVLSSAALDALARAWPSARLDYLTESAARGLLEEDPRVDGLFLLGGAPAAGRVTGGGTAAAVRWLRARRPDIVLDLFSNPRTALLAALSGAPWRAGLDKRARRFAYNVRVPRFRGSAATDHRWALDVQLDFLRAAGIAWDGDARPGIALAPADREFAGRVLAELGFADRRFGAVLPGGSWATKRWPPERFAAAARAVARVTGAPAVVVWGPPEREDAARIAELAGAEARLAPPSTLRGMAAVLGRASLVVATDCLGRHLAIVQGVATVGVFGPTDPRHWTPPEGPHATVRAEGGGPAAGVKAEAVTAAIAGIAAEAGLDTPRGDA